MEQDVRVRYACDPPSAEDGRRVLVDLAWPRGLPRNAARVDAWITAVAPSADLRRWHGREPANFAEFRRRYRAELREPQRALALVRLKRAARRGTVTLLTASRDIQNSPAAVLAERLRSAKVSRPGRCQGSAQQ